MNSAEAYVLRRATSEDLPTLREAWSRAQVQHPDLDKRFTDFQIAEDKQGNLRAAVGMQIVEKVGVIYGETIPDFGETDVLRPLLWERLQTVAKNHGLFRVFTSEDAPFWKQAGFEPATPELLEKYLGGSIEDRSHWLTLQLRDETVLNLSLDKEFSLFREAEKERTERMLEQARTLKFLATLIAVALFLLVMAGGFLLLRNGAFFNR
jgi:N-acetylglutamate synthase-like GNAT family acetyltransferase